MIDPVTVSPLRQRMIEDMTIRRFGEYTQRDYIRQVRELTAFLGLPPDRAEPDDLRRYQLRLASLGASYPRMNLACTALRFFFHVTLGRTGFGDRMARIPTPERLPVVLAPEEVALLARIRQIIAAATPAATEADRGAEISVEQSDPVDERRPPCPCCGGRMILVERFAPGTAPRTILAVRSDTS